MVHLVEIGAMLPGVVQTGGGDLGEPAGAVPAGRWVEGVEGGDGSVPVGWRGGFFFKLGVSARQGRAVVENALVVAVPGGRLDGEAVGLVGCAFVVAVDLDIVGECQHYRLMGWLMVRRHTTST